ncbi:MAG TPA: hypothetical protein VF209_01720 [Patescibacteria group bacterium]
MIEQGDEGQLASLMNSPIKEFAFQIDHTDENKVKDTQKLFKEKRDSYVVLRKEALIKQIKDPNRVLNTILQNSQLYNSSLVSEETKEFLIERCAEIIAHFEFGVNQAAEQMMRISDQHEDPNYIRRKIRYSWEEGKAFAYHKSFTIREGETVSGIENNSIFLNLARVEQFIDETYAWFKIVGGANQSMLSSDVAFFAGLEEAAHWLLAETKQEKRDIWSYPIPDPNDPSATYYYANSYEFRALVWKAYFEFKLGVNYGFKEKLQEARKLIREYEENNGIKGKKLL